MLSDGNKRQIYDQHGEDGLKHEAGFDGSTFDFNFQDFFKNFDSDPFSQKRKENNNEGGFFNSFFGDEADMDEGDSFFGSHFGFGSNNNDDNNNINNRDYDDDSDMFPSHHDQHKHFHDSHHFGFGHDNDLFDSFGEGSFFQEERSSGMLHFLIF